MKPKRILIFGGTGMLGHKLVQQLGGRFEVYATVRGGREKVAQFGIFDADRLIADVEASDPQSIERAIEDIKPDVVINAIGIIKQLPSSHDVIQTLTTNSILPHRLADYGSKHGFRLICVSTDCVFSGKTGNYREVDVSDALDLYGKSKNLGEVTDGNCLTIRSSIIGRELGTAHSLVDWFLSNRGGRVNGFANAIYSGFPTIVFADIISDLITQFPDLRGLYHVSSDPINKFDLLNLINRHYDAGIEIEKDENFAIDRSLDSSKFRNETGFSPLNWDEMVRRMADDPTPYDLWK